MNKIIIAATLALVTTITASSAFAGGCHDTYTYDSSYSTDTYTPYISYDSSGY